MKKCYLLLWALLLLPSVNVYSLDVILTKSRMQIQCNIISQDENTVTYQLIDSQDKELYTMEKSDIEKIYPQTEDVLTPKETKKVYVSNEEKANDVLVLKDGVRLNVILVEVADKQVKYRKVNNPQGPLFVKEIANISSIIYANGEKEEFPHESAEITEITEESTKNVVKNQESGFVYTSENKEITIIYNFEEKTIHIYADKPLMYHSKDVRNIAITTWYIGEKESYVFFDMINKLEGVAILSGMNAFIGNITFHKQFKRKMPKTFLIELPYETTIGSYKMTLTN